MAPSDPAILTIGYGHREIADFIALLREHNVGYVGDVRSRANSGYNPDFSADRLKEHLNEAGITYVFLGDTLGGDPENEQARVETRNRASDSYVIDYQKLREEPAFQQGMNRLRTAWETRSRLALMCSEAKPEQCHRVRLIGEALVHEDIPVQHIDEAGVVRSQQEIMLRIDKGQSTLPGFGPSSKSTRSSRSWKPRQQT